MKKRHHSTIPLYLHNPALLKAEESLSDPKISMLSPSPSPLSFSKTGECADMWTHFPSAGEMLIRTHATAQLQSSPSAALTCSVFKSLSCALITGGESNRNDWKCPRQHLVFPSLFKGILHKSKPLYIHLAFLGNMTAFKRGMKERHN